MDSYIQEHFTKKGLHLEGYPIQNKESGLLKVKNSKGEPVASLRFLMDYTGNTYTENLMLESIIRYGKERGNNSYKGIAKSLIPLFLSEAYRLRIPKVTFTAVPDSRGAEAQKLFNYYAELGAIPVSNVKHMPKTNIQHFQYDVESALKTVGIDISYISRIPIQNNSENEYIFEKSNSENRSRKRKRNRKKQMHYTRKA